VGGPLRTDGRVSVCRVTRARGACELPSQLGDDRDDRDGLAGVERVLLCLDPGAEKIPANSTGLMSWRWIWPELPPCADRPAQPRTDDPSVRIARVRILTQYKKRNSNTDGRVSAQSFDAIPCFCMRSHAATRTAQCIKSFFFIITNACA